VLKTWVNLEAWKVNLTMDRFSMKRKLQLLSGAGIAGLAVFAALAFFTVNQIQVGSAFFEQKRISNAVAADFENPPQSLQKVYSLAIEAEDATTPAERDSFIAKIRDARKAYEAGHQHYLLVLPPGPLHDLIAGESDAATEAWYNAAENAFFPALISGGRAAADTARLGPLEAAYRRDATAVDEITRLTDAWDAANDLAANQLVKLRIDEMAGVALVLLFALVLLGRNIRHQMTYGIEKILHHMEKLAACDLSETIEVDGPEEFARMLTALDKSVAAFRDAVHSVREGAHLIGAASVQMEAATQKSASEARYNSEHAQKAAAAIAEISAAIHEVVSCAGVSVETAQNTASSAQNGSSVVSEAVLAVRGIANATNHVEDRINTLGEQSEHIGRIVTTIEEIAGQTNLLALNAAIEAARAGENGRGFAVVAGEVRRLAERTTLATNEVRQMVGAIQQETEATVQAMQAGTEQVESGINKTEATASVFQNIRELAQTSGDQAGHIATSAQQQSAAIREIHTTIDSMAAFVGHTSQVSEQTADACASLSKLAADLKAHSARFRLPGDGLPA
jgi:methyl-accepting chemotaxis protein